MVRAKDEALNSVFLQTLLQNDRVLLKTILHGFTRATSQTHLKKLLSIQNELGGLSPLQYVCLQGNSMAASVLIDTGSTNVDEKGQYGWTSLHAASYSGDLDTVQILLNSCADCFSKDENGNLPIDFAANSQIRKLLIDTMDKRNSKLFEELNKIHDYTKKDRFSQRSKSCIPDISTIKLNELQIKLREYNSSSTSEEAVTEIQIPSLTKWNTYSNLATELIYNPSRSNQNTF